MKSMKKFLSLILCFVTLVLCGCGNSGSGDDTTAPQEQGYVDPGGTISDGKTLKVLAITSSFGLNTTELLHEIAMAEGADEVIVARLYASGCTLESHVNNLTNNIGAYEYTKKVGSGWKKTTDATMLYGLIDEDWDVIFMQQGAARAGQVDTYKDYVDTLLDYVLKNKTNPNARLVWNLTWAYDQNTDQAVFKEYGSDQMKMYNAIVDAVKEKIVPHKEFAAIIPSGTAIQNARTYYGDVLTKDTFHLNDLGRVIAGYTMYATLTGKELTKISLDQVKTTDFNVPTELTETDKQVIIKAVNAALNTPYSVTQIAP